MEEVTLKVTVQVDSDGKLDRAKSLVAAKMAIETALKHAEDRGFVHPWSLEASVGVVDVEVMDA